MQVFNPTQNPKIQKIEKPNPNFNQWVFWVHMSEFNHISHDSFGGFEKSIRFNENI